MNPKNNKIQKCSSHNLKTTFLAAIILFSHPIYVFDRRWGITVSFQTYDFFFLMPHQRCLFKHFYFLKQPPFHGIRVILNFSKRISILYVLLEDWGTYMRRYTIRKYSCVNLLSTGRFYQVD